MQNPGSEENSDWKDGILADPDYDSPLTPIVARTSMLLNPKADLFEVWKQGGDQALAEKYNELYPTQPTESDSSSTPELTSK